MPKALAADLKKFDKGELQKTKTEEKILTPSLAAAGKPIRDKYSRLIKYLEIAREKSMEALASFDQESKLKHIDVKEKNTLPTKEQILQEKQNK